MKRWNWSSWLLVVLVGVLGCGGGDDDPFGELESDPFPGLESETDFGAEQSSSEAAAAQSTLTSALALDSVVDNPEQSLTTLTVAYNGVAAMLGSALGEQASFLVGPERQRIARLVERAASRDVELAAPGFPDCVTVEETATSVVVSFDCEETEGDLTAAMTGTIGLESDGTTTTFSVRVHATAHGSLEEISLAVDAAFLGDLTISPTAVAGELMFRADLEQSYQGMRATASYLGKVIYDVMLEGPGCAVGGDIKVAMELDVDAPSGSLSVSGVGQAVFGPACNEVTVYARATST